MPIRCYKKANFLNQLLLYLICLSPSLGFALEITVTDSGPLANQNINLKKVEPVYPRASASDVMCGKSHHMARFRINDTHAGLPFSITAKKMTRVKIRWDHMDKVLFAASEKKKTIVFPHAGGESRLYFRAYEPVSGNVYIMDDQNAVIKTCPYSFLPAKHYNQSINVNVNETEYEHQNDKSNNISINYRISSRSAVPAGPAWSWSVGVSQSESSTGSQRVNSNLSYSW